MPSSTPILYQPGTLESLPAARRWLDAASRAGEGEVAVLVAESRDSAKKRLADKTRTSYDYWWGRFVDWCEKPASRHRLRNLDPLPVSTLLPVDVDGEQVIALFLHDLYLGPTDDPNEDWMGPPAPSTFELIVSALKSRTGEECGAKWAPSEPMLDVLKGLGRKARHAYGPEQQATPLLDRHVAAIARCLWTQRSPEAARDRLILELTAAGLTPGDIARLRRSDIRPGGLDTGPAGPRRHTCEVHAATVVVPGQRRRGGKHDPPKAIDLHRHPHLSAAIDAHLEASATTDHLIDLAPSYRSGHVTRILCRLAELAEVSWRPSRRSPEPNAHSVDAMRRLFECPRDWPGQVRVQRDLAMLWLGFYCALRRSELCALTLGDIAHLETGKGLRINIAMSKTDQAGKGARLPLHRPTGPVPRHLDAVGLVWEWVTFMRSLPGATSATPLFPALDRWGHVLERTVNGTRVQYSQLDPQSWSNRLQELARAARVFGDDLDDVRYSQVKGHSLRRGYVTTALLAGLDATVIALQTRHRDIRMIRRYADEIQLLEGMNLADALSSHSVAEEGGGGSAEGRTVEMAVLANARPSR